MEVRQEIVAIDQLQNPIIVDLELIFLLVMQKLLKKIVLKQKQLRLVSLKNLVMLLVSSQIVVHNNLPKEHIKNHYNQSVILINPKQNQQLMTIKFQTLLLLNEKLHWLTQSL